MVSVVVVLAAVVVVLAAVVVVLAAVVVVLAAVVVVLAAVVVVVPPPATVTVRLSRLTYWCEPAVPSNQTLSVCDAAVRVALSVTVVQVLQFAVAGNVWLAAMTVPSSSILRLAVPLPAL